MFVFASSLELADDMMQNKMVRHHANQVIKILDKIVILLTKSLISEQDKINLFELGKNHYHFGLKKEHFQVFSFTINTVKLPEPKRIELSRERGKNPPSKIKSLFCLEIY
jgi:hypothetical protein